MLELYLPKDKVIWALAHPTSKNYIHQQNGVGYQECQLIITEENQPAKIELKEFPQWAQNMIQISVNNGSLINKGETSIVKKKEILPAKKAAKVSTKKTVQKKKTQRIKKNKEE